MLLWIVMALMTAAACLAVIVPLGRARRAVADPAISIYRDQFGELDRDVERGLIGKTEATAARTEIARRLIHADAAAVGGPKSPAAGPRRAVMIAAIVAIPIAAVGIYLFLGSPQKPDMPLAARLSAPTDQQDVPALIARVESHLASNPADGRGWELIAPIYQRLGRADDAARAFANALRLLGSTAEREANLGEAMVRANDGIVSSEAHQAFDRSLALDPNGLRPRFFLALALSQEGKKTEALAAWHALLAEAPAGGAPWADIAKEAVARLEGVEPSTSPGPSAAEVEAANDMTPEQRMAMIGSMVDSLAARLGAESTDADGWARLIRSYMVLGRKDDALAALAKARTALSADRDKLAIVEAEAKTQGILE